MTLREHRREVLREKLKAVAGRAGIDVSVLSRLERGDKPSPYRVPDLAKGYCLTIEGFNTLLGDGKHEKKKQGVRNHRGVPQRGSAASANRGRKAS